MLYAKACNIVVVQLNDKETADNKYMNMLYDKQQYWFRILTTIKNVQICISQERGRGEKDFPPPLR